VSPTSPGESDCTALSLASHLKQGHGVEPVITGVQRTLGQALRADLHGGRRVVMSAPLPSPPPWYANQPGASP